MTSKSERQKQIREGQRAYRERMRAQGFVSKTIWIKPQEFEKSLLLVLEGKLSVNEFVLGYLSVKFAPGFVRRLARKIGVLKVPDLLE